MQTTQSLGCTHYQRKCLVLSPCCSEWYNCSFCHDDKPKRFCRVEMMDNKAIRLIKCLSCNTVQYPTQYCSNCYIEFAKYFCPICKIYDDNPYKDHYHCDFCGVCKVGKKESFYHCHTCDTDWLVRSKDTHKCQYNVFENYCFFCKEDLFYTGKAYQMLDCGHFFHVICYARYLRPLLGADNFVPCPVCAKLELQYLSQDLKYFDKILPAVVQKATQVVPEEQAETKVAPEKPAQIEEAAPEKPEEKVKPTEQVPPEEKLPEQVAPEPQTVSKDFNPEKEAQTPEFNVKKVQDEDTPRSEERPLSTAETFTPY